jgi:hypothetical protein
LQLLGAVVDAEGNSLHVQTIAKENETFGVTKHMCCACQNHLSINDDNKGLRLGPGHLNGVKEPLTPLTMKQQAWQDVEVVEHITKLAAMKVSSHASSRSCMTYRSAVDSNERSHVTKGWSSVVATTRQRQVFIALKVF